VGRATVAVPDVCATTILDATEGIGGVRKREEDY